MALTTANLLAFLAVLAAVRISATIFQALRNPLNRVPGPWLAKFSNLPLKLAVITGKRVYYIQTQHERYGPYVRISPNEIAVNDPKGFKQIHGINSGFEKSDWYKKLTVMPRPCLFDMTDAKDHAARRRLFARGFSKSNVHQNWGPVIQEKIQLVVSQMIAEAARTRGPVDVMKWWTLMASDVSAHLMFGESFHVIERGEANEYIKTLTSALKGSGIGVELPFVRAIGKLLPFQATKELFCTTEVLDDYAKTAVRNMRASDVAHNIFASIQAESEKGETLDDRTVESEAMGLFVAGTDTTAVSLTYLTWVVLARPQLRMDIEREVGGLPVDFEDQDVEKLPLLNAVIQETLRLYGAVPGGLPRTVPHGGIDMDGYYLPQGSIVSTHAYSMHRDPALFPDPEEFQPSRWLPNSEEHLRVSDAAKAVFSPFGSGSRGCLGLHIAYSELRLSAAEFFRRCRGSGLAPSTTEDSMDMENFFIIAPKSHRCDVVLGEGAA
ncbi:hypothetical protein DOTSEDRAFT_33623 [Dothistroma septosporum NZE10]|uniref:Uncharacterized protein n=1 Tax=Dothistroma septosporum (strain NZE10 / CBS 128990) TaxID=675120 RepID=N1PNM5_DOTSN|nr:hypothetical protein DOTSEDRAFT_33623 [Dothistroma septosporum NZE10]